MCNQKLPLFLQTFHLSFQASTANFPHRKSAPSFRRSSTLGTGTDWSTFADCTIDRRPSALAHNVQLFGAHIQRYNLINIQNIQNPNLFQTAQSNFRPFRTSALHGGDQRIPIFAHRIRRHHDHRLGPANFDDQNENQVRRLFENWPLFGRVSIVEMPICIVLYDISIGLCSVVEHSKIRQPLLTMNFVRGRELSVLFAKMSKCLRECEISNA